MFATRRLRSAQIEVICTLLLPLAKQPFGFIAWIKVLCGGKLITNPFAGILCTKFGYTIPMFIGFIIMFSSTMSFAFAQTYTALFVSRAIQGFGSSLTAVSGVTMLCDRYKDSDEKRGKAVGLAGSGLSLGLAVGPVYGGTLYTYFGMKVPFLFLAGLALFDGLLRLSIISWTDLKSSGQSSAKKSISIFKILLDPYIAICLGALFVCPLGAASLETLLPTWMSIEFHSNPSIQGLAFLSLSLTLFISSLIFGWLGFKIGRWLCAILGLILMAVSLFLIPLSKSVIYSCVINSGAGFAVGMVVTPILPLIMSIGDLRFPSVRANLPSIGVSAYCSSYFLGPILSGCVVKYLTFQWTLYIIAILCLIYSPLLLFLRNIPPLQPDLSDESR
ncbi:unnamed protein product, partial [Rotaria magnacalcarata]